MSGGAGSYLATIRRERGREASREKQSGPQAPRHLFEALDLTRPAQVCPWSFSALSQLLSMLFSRQVMSESLRRRGLQHSRFLPFPVSGSVLRLKSIESVMPSSHLVLCRPLLLLPSVFPIIRVFPNKPGAVRFTFRLSQRELGLRLLHLRWLWP